MLHSRQLQVVSPCDSFAGTPAQGDRPAYCTSCSKHVHDLSRMSEREVLSFAARHRDGDVCISYEAREDGSVVTREKARALAPAALALSLAGCAGHMGGAAETKSECVDAQGYAIDCPPTSRLDLAVIPGGTDELPAEPEEIDAPHEPSDERDPSTRSLDTSDAASWRAEPVVDDTLVYDEHGDATVMDPNGAPRCRVSKRAVRKILYPRRTFFMGKLAPRSLAGGDDGRRPLQLVDGQPDTGHHVRQREHDDIGIRSREGHRDRRQGQQEPAAHGAGHPLTRVTGR